MGLDRITNFNITHREQNPRHPPCLSRERFIACYNVINLISLNKGETVNRGVTSSGSVAAPEPGQCLSPQCSPSPRHQALPGGSQCCLCLPGPGRGQRSPQERAKGRERSPLPRGAPARVPARDAALAVLAGSLWVQLHLGSAEEEGARGEQEGARCLRRESKRALLPAPRGEQPSLPKCSQESTSNCSRAYFRYEKRCSCNLVV